MFSLLGSDPRFSVDVRGWWSLVGDAPIPEAELDGLSYAVVDVETTGGSPDRGHRITEIAVVLIEGGVIAEDFQTLINPGRSIPPRVAQLTGITDEMVVGAPFFEDVAEDLLDWLEGRVFVAHNAAFDWRFVISGPGHNMMHSNDASPIGRPRFEEPGRRSWGGVTVREEGETDECEEPRHC